MSKAAGPLLRERNSCLQHTMGLPYMGQHAAMHHLSRLPQLMRAATGFDLA